MRIVFESDDPKLKTDALGNLQRTNKLRGEANEKYMQKHLERIYGIEHVLYNKPIRDLVKKYVDWKVAYIPKSSYHLLIEKHVSQTLYHDPLKSHQNTLTDSQLFAKKIYEKWDFDEYRVCKLKALLKRPDHLVVTDDTFYILDSKYRSKEFSLSWADYYNVIFYQDILKLEYAHNINKLPIILYSLGDVDTDDELQEKDTPTYKINDDILQEKIGKEFDILDSFRFLKDNKILEEEIHIKFYEETKVNEKTNKSTLRIFADFYTKELGIFHTARLHGIRGT